MRKLTDLTPGDFPELDPVNFDQAAFEEWQIAAHDAERRLNILGWSFLALMLVLPLFAGVLVAPGVLPLILIAYILQRKPRRLAKDLGISLAAVMRARRFDKPPVVYSPTLKCPNCTRAINVASKECPFCHHAFVDAEVEQHITQKRDQAQAATSKLKAKYAQRRLATLKTLFVFAAILGALPALIIYDGLEADSEYYWANMSLLAYGVALVGIMLVAAWGVAKRKRWGRKLTIGLGLASLPAIPLGTLLGIYTLVVMMSSEVKEAFAPARA